MKHLFFIFIVVFCVEAASAQVFSKRLRFNTSGHEQRSNWSYINYGNQMITTKSNRQGYFVAHSDESDSLYRQSFGVITTSVGLLTNLDRNGNRLWTKMYRYNYYTQINNFEPISNHNYILRFVTDSVNALNIASGWPNTDIFTKIDSNGTILWSKRMGFDTNSNYWYYHLKNKEIKEAANTDLLFIGTTLCIEIKLRVFGFGKMVQRFGVKNTTFRNTI
jgi:hypothetical protein